MIGAGTPEGTESLAKVETDLAAKAMVAPVLMEMASLETEETALVALASREKAAMARVVLEEWVLVVPEPREEGTTSLVLAPQGMAAVMASVVAHASLEAMEAQMVQAPAAVMAQAALEAPESWGADADGARGLRGMAEVAARGSRAAGCWRARIHHGVPSPREGRGAWTARHGGGCGEGIGIVGSRGERIASPPSKSFCESRRGYDSGGRAGGVGGRFAARRR